MYAVIFIYPHPKAATFGHDHLIDVHVPLGTAMCKKHLGIEPDQILIEKSGEGAPHAAVVQMLFKNKADRDKLPEIGTYEKVQERMRADYDNYTDTPPMMYFAELVEVDVADSIRRYGSE